MTREFSTKPRFEDNGDIEPCDTETRMMNRPDDLGVNEASSVKIGAAPRGDDAVISVPLLQSPTSSQCQGQGDDDLGKPEENNATDELQSVLLNGKVSSSSLCSVTSQSAGSGDSAGHFDAIEDAFAENQDSNDEAFVEIKSAVSPSAAPVAMGLDCHGSQYISSQSSMIDDLFFVDLQATSSSFVSVINSSADDDNSNKPYDDSCNKMTIENQFLTTLMIKPSDYDDDIDLTSEVNNDACWAKQSPSTDVQNKGLMADETNGAIAAGGIGLLPDGVKDQSPKNNAISSKNDSSKNGGTRSDAGAVLSQVATNDIPYFDDNTELPSFKKDAHFDSVARDKPAKISSLSPLNCASQLLSTRSGWGMPRAGAIGLKGGAGGDTSVANGTSGWGPPPAGAGGASTTGWGAPPPPNPVASAAWGAPAPGQGKTQNDDGSNNIPAPVAKPSAPIAAPPPSVVAANASSTSSGVPVQPPQTSTSWAAAAGKGLPTTTNDQTHTTNTASTTNGSTSKHLEQLNSVREALFSQDGWGGSNVKQDSAWNVDVAPAAASSAAGAASASAASASANAEAKESNMWGSAGPTNRNDGTDLWRVNLSGQPASAATKTQANNAWNHTPQNNTDFKQWGVDDEDGSAGANGAIGGQRQGNAGPAADSMWNAGGPSESNGPNHFNKRSNDWSSSGSTGSWGDAPGNPGRNDPMNRNMNDPMGHRDNAPGGSGAAGWGPSPQKQPSGQWSNNPAPSRSQGTWDLESPSMPRRGIDDGTSHWGFKSQQQPAAPGPAGVSHWKDMPNSNNQIRGPPGPAGPRVGGPVKDNSIWPRGPTSGWGNDMADSQMGYGGGGGGGSSWGDLDAKREGSGWPDSNNSSNWGRPRNPVGPSNGGMHRSSPGWGGPDDSPLDGGSGWPTGGLKAPGPKKPTPGNDMSMMWQQNKPYRMLVDMGYRKEDIETALRNSNGTLEDAVEVLNSAGRMPQSRNDPMFGGHNDASNLYQDGPRGRGGFHGAGGGPGQGMPPFPGQDPGALVNSSGMPGSFNSPNPMIQKMLPSGAGGLNPQSSGTGLPPSSLSMPPISSTRPQQPGSSQPSAQQLRMLVQQIQMAVQAGHLNPQILNQPLAPQTLLLLNQLLQQIKNLQTLQQNHTMAQAQKGPGMSNSRDLLSISVNITKAKQHITNLQNQISAQQATYLKSQNNMAGSGPASGGLTGSVPPGVAAAEPSMPDLFNELTLSGSSNSGMGDNVGGSRLSQWKLNASDNNLFGNNKSNATSKSSPGLGFGGDDTWGLSSNSTSSGWPDSKPNSGSTNTISTSGVTATSNANNDVLNGIDTFGIPEFEPGKPWKGPGLKNPDEDPTLTPGSVAPSAIDLMSKTNHNSSSTGSSGMSSENTLGLTSTTWSVQGLTSPESNNKPKDSWSTNPTSTLTAMGQDLWGKSGRTPPGLGGWPSTSSSSNGWSSGQNGASNANNNPADAPTWLLMKNLTPQIDGSTLKTLCMQHGPLKNFHLFLNNGIALVMYASGREANKAQKALNNCLLGNTTIQATMTSETDANTIMTSLGGGSGSGGNGQQTSRGATPSSVLPKSTSSNDMWGNSMVPTSIYSGNNSIWGAPSGNDDGQRNTPQLQPYLPGDLLGESNM